MPHTDKLSIFQITEVTAQQHKVNLKNGESICRLMSVNRVLLSNSVKNDITLCLFKRRNITNSFVYG